MSDENNKTAQEENFTLEDILAEVKGDAFIAGERKLPSDVMRKRAEEIMSEARGESDEEPERELVVKEYDTAAESESEWRGDFAESRDDGEDDSLPELVRLRDTPARGDDEEYDTEYDTEYDEEPQREKKRGLFGRRRDKKHDDEEETPDYADDEPEDTESEENDGYDELSEDEAIPENEPELKDICRMYGAKARALRSRSLIAGLVCIPLLYMAFASYYTLPLSSVLNKHFVISAAIALGFELIVMILGFDIVKAGIKDLFCLRANMESLVTVSCLASLADAVWTIVTKTNAQGAPFCAAAAISMLFAMIGAYKTARGYMLTFRSASKIPEMYCVTAEYKRIEGGSVLYKMRGDSRGFVTKSHRESLPERVFSIAAPLMLAAAVLLSLGASVAKGQSQLFFRCFSAICAVAAPFSLLLIFGQPFRVLAGRLSNVGAAVAGWQGARDIGNAIGMVVREGDLFPSGMLSVGGINIMGAQPRERVITCTGSLIIASGSGLSEIFEELLKSQRCRIADVRDFAIYEGGGVSGTIDNVQVLIGSWGFLNLMGIRVPESMNIKSAVFCAIDKELSGVFTINYNPTGSVQSALTAILPRKMLTLFALRDFNITTLLLKQKFKLQATNTEGIEILSFAERYKLSEPPEEKKQPSALIFREGLSPYVHVVLGGRSLQTTVIIGTVITLLGAVLGIALMAFLCFKGTFGAATVANALTYMFAWLLPTFLLKRIVGRY